MIYTFIVPYCLHCALSSLHDFAPSLCMQVRSYCRGIVVRAVPPETRLKLFDRLHVKEMASLRSFLDPPVGKGKTIKGSGKVAYHLYSRNHTSQLVQPGSTLHRQVLLLLVLFV
jgi:hypothetical protein